jgi:hypothetical protein
MWRYWLVVLRRAALAGEDINQHSANQNEREECDNVFALLFVAEALLVAALALSLRQLNPFFEID